MSKRRFQTLKKETSEALKDVLKATTVKLFDMKMDQHMGNQVVSGDFWKCRKDIAMIRTIQTQRVKEQT